MDFQSMHKRVGEIDSEAKCMYSQLPIRFSELFLFTAEIAESAEKNIVGWLQASIFELRPDMPPEKLIGYLRAAS